MSRKKGKSKPGSSATLYEHCGSGFETGFSVVPGIRGVDST